MFAVQFIDRYLTRMVETDKHARPLLKADGFSALPHIPADVPKKKDW